MDIVHWPVYHLRPESVQVNPVPFTRGGGRSLGGITRATRTDRGYWRIGLENIWLPDNDRRRTWSAIRSALGGRAGLCAVPAWSNGTAPYANGVASKPIETTHSDGTTFSDGTGYSQGSIAMQMVSFAPIGAMTATIRILVGDPQPSGIRFSYQHALYETGRILQEISADTWRVELSTAIRAPIPANAWLEADMPTCLCRLVNDSGMDAPLRAPLPDTASVDFVEAVDYWNDAALGLTA